MSKRMKSNLIKYGISGGICLLLAVAYVISADFLNLELKDQYRILCDAFAIPGMLCIFGGLLVWLGNEGAFDGIGYVLSYAFRAFLPGTRMNKRESYKDYLERKRGKRTTGYSFVFVVGLVCMTISFVFLALFHMQ